MPATEVMVSSARVREYISDKIEGRDLREVIAQGHMSYGIQIFDQSFIGFNPNRAPGRRRWRI